MTRFSALLILLLAVLPAPGCAYIDVLRTRSEAERLYREGRTADIIPLVESALARVEPKLGPDHRYVAEAYNGLAVLYAQALNDFERSEQYFQKALEIRTRTLGPEHPDTIETLNLMGFLYQVTGDLPRAEEHFTRALALRSKVLGAEHPDTADSQIFLAGLYMAQGRYLEAQTLYLEASVHEQQEVSTRHPSPGNALAGLGAVHRTLGDRAGAERYFREALALREQELGPDHTEVAHLLGALGDLRQEAGDHAAAEIYMLRKLEIHERNFGPDHGWTGDSLLQLAMLYARTDRNEEAEEFLRRSQAVYERALGPDNPRSLNADLAFALLDLRRGDPGAARVRCERVLASPRLRQLGELTWAAQTVYSLALWKLGQPEPAILFGKQAVNDIQARRARIVGLDPALQQGFALQREIAFKSLAQQLIEQGRLPEAQQVLQMLKEDEYFSFIRRDAGRGAALDTRIVVTPREQPWLARYEAISDRLAALGAELAERRRQRQRGLVEADDPRLAELRADMKVAQAAFREFLEELGREIERVPRARAVEIGQKNLDKLRAMQGTLRDLGHGAVLVHTLITDETLFLIVTTGEAQLVRRSEIPSAELHRRIHAFRQALQDPRFDPRPASQAVQEVLLAPIAEDLRQAKARTLMFSMDGALRYVPPAALYDGERYLVEDYSVALFTESAQTRLTTPPTADWSLAGLGLTQAVGGFEQLPGVETELERIVRHGPEDADGVLPGVIHLDGDFTSERMVAVLDEGFPVIHIASHFVFQPGTERDSYLLLGDGGRLSLARMVEENFDFNDVDLLTLSACDTAMGSSAADGREIEGFGWLAQRQGAKAVLATLWPVADESTSRLMERLYVNRRGGALDKAEALRRAQLDLLRGTNRAEPAAASAGRPRHAHPYYWAPFILMGNWL